MKSAYCKHKELKSTHRAVAGEMMMRGRGVIAWCWAAVAAAAGAKAAICAVITGHWQTQGQMDHSSPNIIVVM